jgi:hypothetical protein
VTLQRQRERLTSVLSSMILPTTFGLSDVCSRSARVLPEDDVRKLLPKSFRDDEEAEPDSEI